jgi:hypothetical protein
MGFDFVTAQKGIQIHHRNVEYEYNIQVARKVTIDTNSDILISCHCGDHTKQHTTNNAWPNTSTQSSSRPTNERTNERTQPYNVALILVGDVAL